MDRLPIPVFLGFPYGSAGKESACSVGDPGSIPGLGRSPGEGKGYPLQYSGLENAMDCIVHGVVKSWTRLSDFHIHTHTHTHTRTQSQVQEVSCFSHRAKVGCSRLAVVLMTHHFLSFCRKNDAWDALPELPPSSLPGCLERTRTSVTVTKTVVTVWQLPGALKTLPHSLLRATPYEEGVTTIPVLQQKKK